MKFDYIVANPPYNKTLHLDVFKKCIDTLDDNGELVIIEPATWLIDLKDKSTRSNAYKLYTPFKKELEGHIKSIEIENRNDDFSTSMIVPFSIVHYSKVPSIDKQIEFTCFGNKTYIDSIFDANFIGKKDIIDSILNKIKLHDCVNNHILNSRNKNKENISYIRYRDISGRHSYPSNADKIKINDGRYFYSTYILPLIHHKDQQIYFTQPKNAKGKPSECVVGTYQELINYKHYVLSNNLPLFINICMTIDQNNNSLKYVPWLVDKQYTDDEIYKMFNFTQQEINLIEKTVRKFEYTSPFFIRLMTSVNRVSNKEVQDFCDELDKRYPTNK